MLSIIENMVGENNIGDNILKYRSKQGLSRENIVSKSSVKYTTLTKIESGVIKMHQFGYGENRQSVGC
jgi:ribosome-binding protein aMBF1 (putative translation factor)